MQSRIAGAPKFRFDRPSPALLDRLVQQYQDITGDQIRPQKKRNFLAACYRVHGADVIPYIADEFAARGTAQNLLGIIRSAVPRGTEDDSSPPNDEVGPRPDASRVDRTSTEAIVVVLDGTSERPPDHDGPPCPVERCRPNLIYCEDHRPAFDPSSRRRYDRHPSNPDAARYFRDQGITSGNGSPTTSGTRAK